jgi:hypothetical protein
MIGPGTLVPAEHVRRTARQPKLREQRNGDSFIVFSLQSFD